MVTGEGNGPHPPSTGTGLRPPGPDLTAAQLGALRTAQQLVESTSEILTRARAARNALIVELARAGVPYRAISLATADETHAGLSVPAIGKITSAAGVTRYTPRREPPPDEHRTS